MSIWKQRRKKGLSDESKEAKLRLTFNGKCNIEKKGRIVHRSDLNNKNNKNLNAKYKKIENQRDFLS